MFFCSEFGGNKQWKWGAWSKHIQSCIVIMPVMILAFNPVNLNLIYVNPPGIIPRCHLNTEIRQQTKAESFSEKVVKGSCQPPMGPQQNHSAGDK